MKIQIIYESDNYLVINKPAGLVVHDDGRTGESSVADWVLENYPEIKGMGEPMEITVDGKFLIIDRPGIVHRLDRDTSGCLVIAKNQDAFENLKKQFQDKSIEKIYRAFVYGQPKDNSGTIEAPIGRSPKDFRRWSAQPGARGQKRESVTNWQVIGRLNEKDGAYSYMEFRPGTGRTHQIRVHAKFIHHPIVSDALYAGKREQALGFNRQALHAYQITFFDMSGDRIAVVAPLPSDFQQVLDKHNLV